MIVVLQTKKFFMTYFVIWVVARVGKFPRLKTERKLGEEPGQKRV